MYAYSGGVFYDIHPIRATVTLTNAFTTTNGSAEVTITYSTPHNLNANDIDAAVNIVKGSARSMGLEVK